MELSVNFRSTVLILAVVMTAWSAFAADESRQEQGLQALKRGDRATAIALFTQVIDDPATTPELLQTALQNRGSAYLLNNNAEAAARDFDRAIELNPEQAALFLSRGTARGWLGDRTGAMADFDQALKLKPEYAEVHYNRGFLHERLEELDDAIAAHTRAIALNPKFGAAAVRLAKIHGRLGDPSKGISVLDSFLRQTEDSIVLFTRGNLRLETRKPADALVDFTRSIELAPDFAPAYTNRGAVLSQLGHPTQALIDFEKALALVPDDPTTLNQRGNAYRMLNRLDEALRDYAKVVAIAPEDSGVRLNLATIHMIRSEFDAAIREMTAVMNSGTGPEMTQYYRGHAYLTSGDLTAAKRDLEAYVANHPDDVYASMMLYITLARWGERRANVLAAHAKEKPAEWSDHLARRVAGVSNDEELFAAVDSGSPGEATGRLCEAHYYLAQLRLIEGDRSSARKHFEAALATNEINYLEHQGSVGELQRLNRSAKKK
jgi:tetratricopeptide (TPR) repeat protein